MATCHPDLSEKAKGLCAKCYRADLKAKADARALERGPAKSDEKNAEIVLRDLEKDPEVKKRFFELMWSWLDNADIAPIYKMEGDRKVRDYATEAKLGEIAQRRADKAATVLGRAYVVEKREEVKPVPLPLGSEIDASGWGDDENEIDKGVSEHDED